MDIINLSLLAYPHGAHFIREMLLKDSMITSLMSKERVKKASTPTSMSLILTHPCETILDDELNLLDGEDMNTLMLIPKQIS